jgi:hypothetical protein
MSKKLEEEAQVEAKINEIKQMRATEAQVKGQIIQQKMMAQEQQAQQSEPKNLETDQESRVQIEAWVGQLEQLDPEMQEVALRRLQMIDATMKKLVEVSLRERQAANQQAQQQASEQAQQQQLEAEQQAAASQQQAEAEQQQQADAEAQRQAQRKAQQEASDQQVNHQYNMSYAQEAGKATAQQQRVAPMPEKRPPRRSVGGI